MTATDPKLRPTDEKSSDVVEMAWDPITRIVGSLGIYANVNFKSKTVEECHSTSSIFRGYSIFMKGKDPRDAHFITSRICGICGDNHATCSVYAQNMAYGVAPPHLGEWIVNLGEAAEYMFDHNIFQENLVGVDYCERMVKETNPSVLELANRTEAPHAGDHGYRTIGDIMRSLNPLEGEFYREALHVSRYTREMFCLMEGRHVHPSTLYPGGVGTVATIQLFTDYLTRLMRYIEFMKKVVPLHDDLFDFFYEALPGYEHVGERRVLLGCWGSLQDPAYCDFTYRNMESWGRKMFVTPGVIVDGKLVTNSLVDINLGLRILLGSSYYDDWVDGAHEKFVERDPLGNQIDVRHPWNQHTLPKPQKRDFAGAYSWTMSPRWFDGTDHLALDTGGGPIARLWSTALSGLVNTDYIQATGHSVKIQLPRTALKPATEYEWKIPRWSNALERNRARTYFQAYAAALALHFCEKAMAEVRAGRTDTWTPFKVPDEAISCGFTEAVRGVLSHHMVIREGKIANYHPYPPTPWNGSVRDSYGTPGPYEDAVQNTPIFEENPPDRFKGIDIMRAVRSFDPCLPCGVHMYVGNGREKTHLHSPSIAVKPY
ncbi:nickel-dependent hydrogenase large subunit [Kribbella soli]|uniref:Hydrogenase n=1 Tax=Kribbella soli TaxID=1124743 RepID=A0A4R0H7S4_9ACTN|nr:nickel-dependent hydrogenase large subunit [Kribbella soli]TCC03729.1 hydrogenase [Kribbella soli]